MSAKRLTAPEKKGCMELIEKHRAAAEADNHMSQYYIADAHDNLNNKTLAVYWMQKSAEGGVTEAMLR